MDRLLDALANPGCRAVIEYLLGTEPRPSPHPQAATQAAICAALAQPKGTVSKHVRKLADAHLVVTEPGQRADQPVLKLRQPGKVRLLLAAAAALDAEITEERAFLLRIEADFKSDIARRFEPRPETL